MDLLNEEMFSDLILDSGKINNLPGRINANRKDGCRYDFVGGKKLLII